MIESEGGRSRAAAIGWALLFFLVAVYLLSYSGGYHSSDEISLLSVTESLAKRGKLDTNQVWWLGLQQGIFGDGGDLYSRKFLGTSLAALPLGRLSLVVEGWGFVQTAMLLNVLVTAAIGVLLFFYLHRLGHGLLVSLSCALLYGLATLAWPYSKYFFAEPLTALGLLAGAYFLRGYRDRGDVRDAVLAGAGLAVAVATQVTSAVTLPLFLCLFLYYVWEKREGRPFLGRLRSQAGALLGLGAPLALALVLVGVYNQIRFGSPLNTGYLALPHESFSASWLTSIPGLLVSPGRGILLYSPILLASLAAWPSFYRRYRAEAILAATLVAAYLLLYGRWFMWHGGFAWGPRTLVPILPFFALPLAAGLCRWRGWRRWAVLALASLSVIPQILGISVAFGHFQEVLVRLPSPLFDPITFFDPRYSPLVGQWAFMRPELLDFGWVHAAREGVAIDAVYLGLGAGLVGVSGATLAWLASGRAGIRRGTTLVLVVLGLITVNTAALSMCLRGGADMGDFPRLGSALADRGLAGDVIVVGSSRWTEPFQNWYKGGLPVYGLNEGGAPLGEDVESLLENLARRFRRVWLVPDSLPPAESSLDRWLIAGAFPTAEGYFGEVRLALYSFAGEGRIERQDEELFEGGIALVGYAVEEGATSGDVLHLSLFWEAREDLDSDVQVFAHLVDGRGRLWAQSDGKPAKGLFPTSGWTQGFRVEDRRGLLVPPAAPPGSYELVVGLYDAADGHRLKTAEGTDQVRMATIEIEAPKEPPSLPSLGMDHELDARLDGEITLLGCDLAPGPYAPGDAVAVTLYWRSEGQVNEPMFVSFRWDGAEAMAPEAFSPDYLPDRWAPGQVVADRREVRLPPQISGGTARLAVRVHRADGTQLSSRRLIFFGGDPWIPLGTVEVTGRTRSFQVPDVEHAQGASLGEGVRFLGYDMEPSGGEVEPGGHLRLTLYWQAASPMEVSYTVFVHVIDDAGRIWAQHDGVPGEGGVPTIGWVSGEVVEDRHLIRLGQDVPPGGYAVEIGMYDAGTGQRLSVEDSGDRILLLPIRVGP